MIKLSHLSKNIKVYYKKIKPSNRSNVLRSCIEPSIHSEISSVHDTDFFGILMGQYTKNLLGKKDNYQFSCKHQMHYNLPKTLINISVKLN